VSGFGLSELATWDDRLLAEELKDLSLLGLDFSLEVLLRDAGLIKSTPQKIIADGTDWRFLDEPGQQMHTLRARAR